MSNFDVHTLFPKTDNVFLLNKLSPFLVNFSLSLLVSWQNCKVHKWHSCSISSAMVTVRGRLLGEDLVSCLRKALRKQFLQKVEEEKSEPFSLD